MGTSPLIRTGALLFKRISTEAQSNFWTCGTTEVVPFPVVALPNLQRDGAWNPMSRKDARHGAHGVRGGAGRQQVPRLRNTIHFADDPSSLEMTNFDASRLNIENLSIPKI